MNRSQNPPRRRIDAYFSASFEVARRLADGRGAEAIQVLRRELERLPKDSEPAGRRFLLSQIALCHSRMGDKDAVARVLEEMEEQLPRDVETSLMLAEGYLHLADNHERASHHAALALQWSEEHGEETPETLSRAQTLLAKAMLAANDLLGAMGAWQASPLPDWRLAIKLIAAGVEPQKVREVLVQAIPRHRESERRQGSAAVACVDQIRRLVAWIDAGCPSASPQSG